MGRLAKVGIPRFNKPEYAFGRSTEPRAFDGAFSISSSSFRTAINESKLSSMLFSIKKSATQRNADQIDPDTNKTFGQMRVESLLDTFSNDDKESFFHLALMFGDADYLEEALSYCQFDISKVLSHQNHFGSVVQYAMSKLKRDKNSDDFVKKMNLLLEHNAKYSADKEFHSAGMLNVNTDYVLAPTTKVPVLLSFNNKSAFEIIMKNDFLSTRQKIDLMVKFLDAGADPNISGIKGDEEHSYVHTNLFGALAMEHIFSKAILDKILEHSKYLIQPESIDQALKALDKHFSSKVSMRDADFGRITIGYGSAEGYLSSEVLRRKAIDEAKAKAPVMNREILNFLKVKYELANEHIKYNNYLRKQELSQSLDSDTALISAVAEETKEGKEDSDTVETMVSRDLKLTTSETVPAAAGAAAAEGRALDSELKDEVDAATIAKPSIVEPSSLSSSKTHDGTIRKLFKSALKLFKSESPHDSVSAAAAGAEQASTAEESPQASPTEESSGGAKSNSDPSHHRADQRTQILSESVPASQTNPSHDEHGTDFDVASFEDSHVAKPTTATLAGEDYGTDSEGDSLL